MPDEDRTDDQSLRDAWDNVATDWAAWARKPGHDSYWRFHRAAFFELIPAPGRITVDIGCGEGRVARDLKALGHNVIAIDGSPTMVEFARAADPSMRVLVADAAHVPLDDRSADLAIAFMSLQDMDDMSGAVSEIGRVLIPGGTACVAIVHPINSAGKFESEEPGARFIIDGSYLDTHRTRDVLERDGLKMIFSSQHWPLEAYTRALEKAGLLIGALREIGIDDESVQELVSRRRWQRLPLFLHLRAVKR